MKRLLCILLLIPLGPVLAGTPRATNKFKRDNRRVATQVAKDLNSEVTAGGDPLTILVDASGEIRATRGYNFPPQAPDDVVFVDGWEVRFSEMLTTIGNVWLASDPDLNTPDRYSLRGKL